MASTPPQPADSVVPQPPSADAARPQASPRPAEDAAPINAFPAPAETAARDARPAADGGAGAPTFTEIYAQLLGVPLASSPSSCGGSGCHMRGGSFDLSSRDTAYAAVKVRSWVANPDQSIIITVLRPFLGRPPSMPKGRLALLPDAVNRLRAWIAAGARDD